MAGADVPVNPAAVRWRCRRGMRELDVLLERYLAEGWPRASAEERAAFVGLLELSDPDLAALCLGYTTVTGVTGRVVGDITRAGPCELSSSSPVYPSDPSGGRLPGAGP